MAEKYHRERQEKLSGIEKYPHKWNVNITVKDFNLLYDNLKNDEILHDVTVSMAGRITSRRESGKKLIFFDFKSDEHKLQALARSDIYGESFESDCRHLREGDIVGFQGHPSRSRRGELSLIPTKVQLLSPCFEMIPQSIEEKEIRYRQRHLDMIVNPNVMQIFKTRSRIISHIRRYLEALDFVEVETPILNTIPGGASARPFVTYHNELDSKMYLRVAPELYLKTLVVGGMERVFEIGRNFRNEGIDLTHNPEFTVCEFYWAYRDYNDLMKITEEYLRDLVHTITGKTEIEYDGKTLNFGDSFVVIDMIDELEKYIGKIPRPFDSTEAKEYLFKTFEVHNIPNPPLSIAKLIDKLVGHFIEPTCINPTFLINHPLVMSPLAKAHRSLPELSERFELFINGKEICNAYTELNDPEIQRERFRQQSRASANGDDEAHMPDESFCKALDYGLPPTAGWGIGIDRLTMLLTNQTSIREVLAFPTMKEVS